LENTKQLIKHFSVISLRLSYGFTERHLQGKNMKILDPKPLSEPCSKLYILRLYRSVV